MDLARYAFRVEWLDSIAALRRQYSLIFYKRRDGKHEIEMVSAGNGRATLIQGRPCAHGRPPAPTVCRSTTLRTGARS